MWRRRRGQRERKKKKPLLLQVGWEGVWDGYRWVNMFKVHYEIPRQLIKLLWFGLV